MRHLQHFKTDISKIKPPKKFTFPFYYQPHQLAEIATKELQDYLEIQNDLNHNFGLNTSNSGDAIGKMFGVLVVKNKKNEFGYLAAFSGKLADNSLPEKFVPPIFNMRKEGSFFLNGEEKINQINNALSRIKEDKNFIQLKRTLKKTSKKVADDLKKEKEKLNQYKIERKLRKKKGLETLSKVEFHQLEKKIAQESLNNQFYYKELQEYYNSKLTKIDKKLSIYKIEIRTLKEKRKKESNYLQQTLFKNYSFLNQKKEKKNLLEIFNDPSIKPPAGSGECSAPKLLQYAFLNDLEPICMAEFWWGKSPNSKIRNHKKFYPACQNRCKPILTHMLDGINLDDNLLIENLSENIDLEIIYEDDVLIIVNKPSEFL